MTLKAQTIKEFLETDHSLTPQDLSVTVTINNISHTINAQAVVAENEPASSYHAIIQGIARKATDEVLDKENSR